MANIKLSNVTKKFRNFREGKGAYTHVIRGVDLDIEDGEFVVP